MTTLTVLPGTPSTSSGPAPAVEPRRVESRAFELELSADDAVALRHLGRTLAKTQRDEAAAPSEADASVLSCWQVGNDRYRVTVNDNVGVISVGDRRLVIEPKVDQQHLFYLACRSDALPRMTPEMTHASKYQALWELVPRWYVAALEAVLHRGLMADYEAEHDVLPIVRGTVRPVETAQQYYGGNLVFSCEYEEFGLDSALNRVLKAAAVKVAGISALDDTLRRRARRLTVRFDGVGALRRGDLAVGSDRRTAHYRDALLLARQVLSATGRAIHAGPHRTSVFLLRTPDLVEAGVRQVLIDGLAGTTTISKTKLAVHDDLTLNPDLLFGTMAIGDVKYKLQDHKWSQPDLYQITAFATGFGVTRAALFSFSDKPGAGLPALALGKVGIEAILWDVSGQVSPEIAAAGFVEATKAWLAQPAELGPQAGEHGAH